LGSRVRGNRLPHSPAKLRESNLTFLLIKPYLYNSILATTYRLMRHAFEFPSHIREAIRRHVRGAVEGIAASRFRQEPSYTSALLSRLEGTAYSGADGSVSFTATDIDSIGRNAAEKWSGADFAITARIAQDQKFVAKAILFQAKLGTLDSLTSREQERLIGQIEAMRGFTRSPKVLFAPENAAYREPYVASGTYISRGVSTESIPLAEYFVRRVLPTLDGDTRPPFVASVQDSQLAQLRVEARIIRVGTRR
jgi:hypothetical protein